MLAQESPICGYRMSLGRGHFLSVIFTLCPLDGQAGGRRWGDEEKGLQTHLLCRRPGPGMAEQQPEFTYSWLASGP